jgi:cell cycle sensor histidine kinase DivJ
MASVSHELRTPLNAIIGFSDMLLLELYGPLHSGRQREHIGLIRDAGHHLLGVVNSILDVSKIASGAHAIVVEPFRFRDAVDMCRSLTIGNAEAKQIELDIQVPGDIGDLNADCRAIQQMLINLVSNAIKFTPNGGRVCIGAKKSGSQLHFWVSDTGIGIAEADLARLGQPFTQVHNDYTRQFDGTGLGLYLVKGLVELHGGSMSIESALGEGTTVTIALPVDGPVRPKEKKGRLVSLDDKRAKDGLNGKLRKTA